MLGNLEIYIYIYIPGTSTRPEIKLYMNHPKKPDVPPFGNKPIPDNPQRALETTERQEFPFCLGFTTYIVYTKICTDLYVYTYITILYTYIYIYIYDVTPDKHSSNSRNLGPRGGGGAGAKSSMLCCNIRHFGHMAVGLRMEPFPRICLRVGGVDDAAAVSLHGIDEKLQHAVHVLMHLMDLTPQSGNLLLLGGNRRQP